MTSIFEEFKAFGKLFRQQSNCPHDKVRIDMTSRIIMCKRCYKKLDPFDTAADLARRLEKLKH